MLSINFKNINTQYRVLITKEPEEQALKYGLYAELKSRIKKDPPRYNFTFSSLTSAIASKVSIPYRNFNSAMRHGRADELIITVYDKGNAGKSENPYFNQREVDLIEAYANLFSKNPKAENPQRKVNAMLILYEYKKQGLSEIGITKLKGEIDFFLQLRAADHKSIQRIQSQEFITFEQSWEFNRFLEKTRPSREAILIEAIDIYKSYDEKLHNINVVEAAYNKFQKYFIKTNLQHMSCYDWTMYATCIHMLILKAVNQSKGNNHDNRISYLDMEKDNISTLRKQYKEALDMAQRALEYYEDENKGDIEKEIGLLLGKYHSIESDIYWDKILKISKSKEIEGRSVVIVDETVKKMAAKIIEHDQAFLEYYAELFIEHDYMGYFYGSLKGLSNLISLYVEIGDPSLGFNRHQNLDMAIHYIDALIKLIQNNKNIWHHAAQNIVYVLNDILVQYCYLMKKLYLLSKQQESKINDIEKEVKKLLKEISPIHNQNDMDTPQ